MNKKYYHGCNKDRSSFAYYCRGKPQTKEEKEYAEEEGFEFIVKHPRTKAERKEAEWMYSSDAERWDSMADYWDGSPDPTVLCDDCQTFLKRKFPKEYAEAVKFWNEQKIEDEDNGEEEEDEDWEKETEAD